MFLPTSNTTAPQQELLIASKNVIEYYHDLFRLQNILVYWVDFRSVPFPFIVGYFVRICRKHCNEIMALKHVTNNVEIVAS
jgi:hypothetical protein